MQIDSNTEIYTTGAKLMPLKANDELGNDIGVWVVNEFVEPSYQNGLEIEVNRDSANADLLIVESI